MKFGFIIPVLNECDIQQRYSSIEDACKSCNVDFEVIFAFNAKLNAQFSRVRTLYIDNKKVKAFKVNNQVNEHKLITIGMTYCEDYDATIIYSAKEPINVEVVKTFIYSWQAGNKIVYLKKEYAHPRKLWVKFKNFVYKLGIKLLGVFKDFGGETDIQLLDKDVVVTINQMPAKNRHLRVLDSFIGYNYDIIKMEVDSKVKDSKSYIDKTKSTKISALIAGMASFFTITLLTFAFLATINIFKMSAIWKILLWALMVCFGVISHIFYTKYILGLRVGDKVDEKEITNLISNIEKYNF